METQTPFRIGGYYRNGHGAYLRLEPAGHSGRAAPDGFAGMSLPDGFVLYQLARLSDGQAVDEDDLSLLVASKLSLLPGEHLQIDGKYVPRGVPVEDKPAETLGDLLRQVLDRGVTLPGATPQPTKERARPALDWNKPTPFDAFGGFFTEPADMADWQDTYYPR